MYGDNSSEIEAALHEDDEPEPKDDLSPEERRIIEEEAMAEEEFIADREDTVNPLFFKKKEEEPKSGGDNKNEQSLDGAFGSEGLTKKGADKPINNEEELRKEKVDEDDLSTLPTDDDQVSNPSTPPTSENNTSGDINASMGAASAVDLSTESLPPSPFVEKNDPAITVETTIEPNPIATSGDAADSTPLQTAQDDLNTDAAPVASTMDTADTNTAFTGSSAPVATEPSVEQPVMSETATTMDTQAQSEAVTSTSGGEASPAAPAEAQSATTVSAMMAEQAQNSAPATPAPIPAGMPSTSDPNANTAAVNGQNGEKPKKKKTGLIVAIVILLVLVCAGIGAFVFYMQHEDPKKQVSDAIENILTAPLGTVSQAMSVAAGKTPSIDLEITSSVFDDKSLNASVAIKDDASMIYFKLSNVGDIYKAAMKEYRETVSEMTYEYDDSDDMLGGMDTVYEKVIDAIEDKWIKVPVQDYGESNEKTKKCVGEALNKMRGADYRKKVVDLYHDYTFITLDESAAVEDRNGVKYYTVLFDEDKAKDFGEKVVDTDEYKELMSCADSSSDYNLSNTSESGEEIYRLLASEFADDDSGDDVKTTVKLAITPWTHELQAIEVTVEENSDKEDKFDVKIHASFSFIDDSSFDKAVTVDELYETIMNLVRENTINSMKEQIKTICESAVGYEGSEYNSIDECIEEYTELFESYYDSSSDDDSFDLTNIDLTKAIESVKYFSLIDES